MLKSYRIPLLIIGLIIALQVLFEAYRPKPIDWKESYERQDKIPHGCYIVYQMLTDYFGEHKIMQVQQPIFNHFNKDHAITISSNNEADYESEEDNSYADEEESEYNNEEESETNSEYTNEDENQSEENNEYANENSNKNEANSEYTNEDENQSEENNEYANENSNKNEANSEYANEDENQSEENNEYANENEDTTINYTPYADAHQAEQFIIINNDFEPDSLDTQYLLQFVKTGGTAFIATRNIGATLAQKLKIDTEWLPVSMSDSSTKAVVNFAHDKLSNYSYQFKKDYLSTYFHQIDTANTTILAYTDSIYPNFIQVKYGTGAFYWHCAPKLLSNYTAISDSGAAYIAQLFAHLPAEPRISYWDEYYKPMARFHNKNTPLSYILSIGSLRWGLYLSLIGIMLLMLFESKRRQRAIPVIEPLRNTTVEFAQTIGMLYYQNGDHRDLAQKKINHFIDFLRTKLFLPPVQYNAQYYELIAQKSELPLSKIENLFKLIIQVRTQSSIEPATLVDLSQQIDAFYAHHHV
jgi:hypothetical protein